MAGRLDGHAKVLHARRPNQRSVSFKAALAAGGTHMSIHCHTPCLWHLSGKSQRTSQPGQGALRNGMGVTQTPARNGVQKHATHAASQTAALLPAQTRVSDLAAGDVPSCKECGTVRLALFILSCVQCAGDEYLYNAQAALIRASLTKHDMIQRPAMMTKKGLGFRDL